MKYLFAVLLLLGMSFSVQAAEAPAKKKAAAKAEAKVDAPSAKAQAVAKTLTPLQKTKLLDLLNKGDDKALQSLPGIGEARAKSIVKARPIADPVDLVKVDGIGDAILAEIVAHAKAGFPVEKKNEAEHKVVTKKKTGTADKKAAKE